MKFIANKDAPNIPLEVLEAQESDSLVIFCGAGISVPSGLPSFGGLVKDVYKALSTVPSDLEQEAIDRNAYDSALGLLENRIDDSNSKIRNVRQQIINRLKIKDGSDLTTHEAILQLARTSNQKYRLVTTNIDHGFQLCNENIETDKAPNLPVPKPHKWESLVHIHGLIDENDPNGKHIVFTSGDFGTAYLTEGWASRFITELFRNYTVLFVGYSIDDPVLRYMTDAIAADRMNEGSHFKESYVIAKLDNHQDEGKDLAKWRAKGVVPILFKNNFDYLHNTLKAWANHTKDGLNSKSNIIRKHAIHPPLPPYDQIESLTQVIDTLKEKSSPTDDNVTGYPAKIFAELEPPAPIEWLPVLFDQNLLELHSNDINFKANTTYRQNSEIVEPNKITYQLWRWITKHLESDQLISWFYEKGLFLNPVLSKLIVLKLEREPPKEPYLKFWKTITSNKLQNINSFNFEFHKYLDLLNINDEFSDEGMVSLFKPAIKLSKPYGWPNRKIDPFNGDEVKPYSIELTIGISSSEYNTLLEQKDFFKLYEKHLISVTGYLINAMDLASLYGLINLEKDNSHWDLPSIEPHNQNQYRSDWTLIIELCRDFIAEALKSDINFAKSVIGVWKCNKYPVFRR
ncbi:MAG: SIR2 family protein, partial [Oceanospirillaceae bacterium]